MPNLPHAPGFIAMFVSAEQAGNSQVQNTYATEAMVSRLNSAGLTYDRVIGQYNGKRECSFRVCLPSHSHNDSLRIADLVRNLAHEFNQDSVLVVGPLGRAVLVYDDDRGAVSIGQWCKCADPEPDGLPAAYTCIGGEFFVIESRGRYDESVCK